MSDPNWKRTTVAERRRPARYLHVSVLVGTMRQEMPGGVILTLPSRTPKGKGATARKNPEVAKIINAGRHYRELRRAARSAD